MALRPSLFSRWLAQPAELLQQSTITLRATRSRTSPSQTLALTRRVLLNGQGQSTTRRSFNSLANRFTTRANLTPRAIHLPRRSTRRANSTNSNNTSQSSSSTKEGSSLSQRLRTLSREYGWAALGVYLGLSALDFPFCFVAVRLLGVERIGHWEHVIVSSVKDVFKSVWPQAESGSAAEGDVGEGALVKLDGEEEGSMEEASIWTQLALAYAVHKSLIFIRVPLTAAVTPKVVKVLRRWGWDIGKRKPKST
ncbi:uncharacterized protein N7473_003148 [Penicillium subrubescens]|uniref:DUF1279 domain-containing protein n=1 Tax=Penicillium subrubescens TaxID=1316194 RepID=A0A1Q5TQ27_9EURO|nr:uncharacterized protein N7473_003148 [Penicillium subrubescens]KAJ5906232.1 hypothetical protein N7473_003148 [Penicillium subrubescens]OKP02329.1 hypothetical protein PENSUB_7093 [Penicillium subrubescens]